MAVSAGAAPVATRAFAGRAFGIDLRANFRVPGVLEPGAGHAAPYTGGRRIELALCDPAKVNATWPAKTAERTFELRRSDGRAVFTIDHEPDVAYRVWIAGLGRCTIGHEGDRILYTPPRRNNRWDLLIGQGLPIAAALQGLEVLHASAVRMGSTSVAFVAPSGTGKTSLALHLLSHGAAFFADDVVALEADGDALLTHPGIGLANAPRAEWAAVGRADLDPPSASQAGWKHYVTVALPDTPVPLGAVYFLERTPAVEDADIVQIDPPDPRLLLGATFVAHVPTAARLITQLDVCSRIARTVPLFRVRTPVEGRASDLAARIAEHVGRL